MASLIEQNGGSPQKQPKYIPIFLDRYFTGLYTHRSVLHDPSDVVTAKFYGGRQDALWMGRNIELTTFLTLQRRPGLVPFSGATYPTPPDDAYPFQLADGTIRVVIDTQSTGFLTVTSVDTASGDAVYHGTFPCGGTNSFVGLQFTIAGFLTNGVNNGTFICTGSTSTTLTLANPNAVSEVVAATAISYGAVYWDQQNGSKTLLFDKGIGAGQTYFEGVGGILYMGDGVDIRKWVPLNLNTPPGSPVSVWNWGIAAPTVQPTVTSVATGAASTVWKANTIFTTMGLTVDTFGQAWQLIGVNADGTNVANAQFGTAGNGNPIWNQALYGTTNESSGTPVIWKNLGQIQAWQAKHQYGDAGVAGVAAPVAIFDSASNSIYLNLNNAGGLGTSGSSKPSFNGVAGSSFWDGGCHWFFFGTYSSMKPWLQSHSYLHWYNTGGPAGVLQPTQAVIEPFLLPPSTQPIYLQVPTNTGTSGSNYAPFPNNASIGDRVSDGQLYWLALGSATWTANTKYFPWAAQGTTFGVVKSGGNMHVCLSGSRSGNSLPTFGALYGDHSTLDGDIIWVNVGPQVTWVGGSGTTGIWNLPPSGFQPPQTSQAYGGSIIDSSSNLVEAVVVSGKSGTVAPSWNAVQTNTADGGAGLVLTQVAVAGTVVTYTGTITGGGANALAGSTFLIAGFTNVGNNGLFYITASTATTLVCVLVGQANETHAGTATTGLIWFAESTVTANSLAWTKSYAYAYSLKARGFDDFYSPAPLGGGNIPPGSTFGALGAPTGSATNAISTASPAFIINGGNTGAVNTITGLGSTDPQVDTIVIWRSADGGGFGQMFELTEIPAPKSIGGIAQPWTFLDFLPDTATSLYPGLNTLLPAPIAHVNDPPFSSYLPMAYNFQRIWGAIGGTVPFSGGPDTKVGNPNEAFPPTNSLPFLAPVTRLVKTPQGLVTFLTNGIEVVAGGPLTSSFYSVTWAAGIGLLSYNALDVLAGEMYFFSADSQFRIMTPSLNVVNAGFPLSDQFANLPASGISDTTWDPSKVYVASHQSGMDTCIFVSDGSTGWYRLNPHQVGAQQNTEPVWSPFAAITNGAQMVQSVEVLPGIKKLLVGASSVSGGGANGGGMGINLFTAVTYGVLAGVSLINSGATTVNGDLGVNPGSTITGAPTVTGATNSANAAAIKAQTDLTKAYNAAAAMPGVFQSSPELGGLVLGPGMYAAPGGTFTITSLDLTLDANGDANAFWIFQMSSALTVSNGRSIILANGAQAKNIFWQVGGSATIGTSVTFKGNILALTSITVQNGSTVAGRLLARNGSVTMDTNTITSPSTVTGAAVGCNKPILQRDLSVYTDNGTAYDAYFVMGSITLAHSGQLALLKHLEFDMSGVNYQPTVSFLLNELSGGFTPFTALPLFDPPSLYGGRNIIPNTYSPLRYYFLGTASLARCRHLQLKVDFGTTVNPDALLNATIVGRVMIEI